MLCDATLVATPKSANLHTPELVIKILAACRSMDTGQFQIQCTIQMQYKCNTFDITMNDGFLGEIRQGIAYLSNIHCCKLLWEAAEPCDHITDRAILNKLVHDIQCILSIIAIMVSW
jgi:hypothetical protein